MTAKAMKSRLHMNTTRRIEYKHTPTRTILNFEYLFPLQDRITNKLKTSLVEFQ